MTGATPRFTAEQVRALVARDEGQFLEFKSLWERSGASRLLHERCFDVAHGVSVVTLSEQVFKAPRCIAASELRQLVEENWLRMEGQRRGAVYLALPPLEAARKGGGA